MRPCTEACSPWTKPRRALDAQDAALYRTEDGVNPLLAELGEHYNDLPETELQDATEDFLACKRKPGQGSAEFTALFDMR